MRAVDALRMIEKINTDAANDAITMTERFLSGDMEVVPRITGRTGNTHGARTVRTPERKLMMSKGIGLSPQFTIFNLVTSSLSRSLNPWSPVVHSMFSVLHYTL